MRAYYCDTFVLPLPEGHRFPMDKYRLLRERLESLVADDPLLGIDFHLPPAATNEQLLSAHGVDYVNSVITGELTPKEQRALGFPWSEAMVERSRRSSGATLAACRTAFEEGIAVNLAGGTHHAMAHEAQGFCVFNDSVIAARGLQAEGLAKRPIVIDLDVHQGNGTASVLEHDSSIFTLSVHGERNFPFTKATSDLDVALPDGTQDAEYLDALDLALAAASQRFTPDCVIYIAGADPFEKDKLGKLSLSKQGLAARDERVFEYCRHNQLPVAVSMAGGYAREIDDIVDIHAQTVLLAANYWKQLALL